MKWNDRAGLLLTILMCLLQMPFAEAGDSTIVRTDRGQVERLRAQRQLQLPNPSERPVRIIEKRGREKENVSTVSRVQMKRLEVEAQDTGGTLIFSDSPEYVQEDGILYRDTVNGKARVFYYHLNDTNLPKKVAVVLDCEERDFTKVHVTRGGMAGGSNDYFSVGKAAQVEYFSSELKDTLYFMKGTKLLLQPKMDALTLQPGELVCGVYDIEATSPIRVSVLMYPVDADPCAFMERARILPKDASKLRGSFVGMNRVLTSKTEYDPSTDGIAYVKLADGALDKFRIGVDATDGSEVDNRGNYGVLYQLKLPVKRNQTVHYYLSPLGGKYAGAMTVQEGSIGKKQLLLTPMGSTLFGTMPVGSTTAFLPEMERADLGVYDGKKDLTFEFSPPGASNLPVNFILMPANK